MAMSISTPTFSGGLKLPIASELVSEHGARSTVCDGLFLSWACLTHAGLNTSCHQVGPVQLLWLLRDICSLCGLPPRQNTRPIASGTAVVTRTGAHSVAVVRTGIPLCAHHSTGISGRQFTPDIRCCRSSPSTLCGFYPQCLFHQLVGQLSVTAHFPWLQLKHGTICRHRPGPSPQHWHSSDRLSLTFSFSHLADRNLSLFLLTENKPSANFVHVWQRGSCSSAV